jgi:hypothetical protein
VDARKLLGVCNEVIVSVPGAVATGIKDQRLSSSSPLAAARDTDTKEKKPPKQRLPSSTLAFRLFVSSDRGRGGWRRLKMLRVILDELLLTAVAVRGVKIKVQHLLVHLV